MLATCGAAHTPSWRRPSENTRMRPGRSVMNMRPSGAKSIAQGTSRPVARTSALTAALGDRAHIGFFEADSQIGEGDRDS